MGVAAQLVHALPPVRSASLLLEPSLNTVPTLSPKRPGLPLTVSGHHQELVHVPVNHVHPDLGVCSQRAVGGIVATAGALGVQSVLGAGG